MATALSQLRSVLPSGMLLGEAWGVRLHRRDAEYPMALGYAAGALFLNPQTSWFACIGGPRLLLGSGGEIGDVGLLFPLATVF